MKNFKNNSVWNTSCKLHVIRELLKNNKNKEGDKQRKDSKK